MPPRAGELCAGAALPTAYALAQPARSPDCDDADPARRVSVGGYADADGDGVGSGPAEVFCGDGSLPAGYVPSGTDCAPADPARWQLLAYTAVDRDGDGVSAPESGTVCTGAALPAPYRTRDLGPGLRRRGSPPCGTPRCSTSTRTATASAPRRARCSALGPPGPPGFSRLGWDLDDQDPARSWDPALEEGLVLRVP